MPSPVLLDPLDGPMASSHFQHDAGLVRSLGGPLESLRAGDPTARDRILILLAGRLRSLGHRMLADFRVVRRWDDTDDVVQNATLRFLRTLDRTEVESARHLLALAAMQIRRELLDLAKRYRGPESHASHHESNSLRVDGRRVMRTDVVPDPNDGVGDVWTRFHEVIETLPPEEREVFDLAWFAGAEQAEVANLVGCSIRTVKRRWEAAKQRLRDAIEGERPSHDN